MAKTQQLEKLFRAISENDYARAKSIAESLAQEEEKRGHRAAAAKLRGSLSPNGIYRASQIVARELPGTEPGGLTSALSRISGTVGLEDINLRPSARRELATVVSEWFHREALHSAAIIRRKKLFFYGPPGCGKSITALALANELSLPTYVVRFDGVIGAYLGQTAIHLRELFRFAESNACVLLFDEIDALGKKRGNPLDVGELDRIVISLMQELEHSSPAGVVVATSNLPRHLDHALWRRFDVAIEFPKPSRRELASFGRKLARQRKLSLPANLLKRITAAPNYVAAEKAVEAYARTLALAAFARNGR